MNSLNQDLLDPLIEIMFNFLLERGDIPEPPEELQGVPLKVEYISIMAEAQKIIGVSSIERFAGFVSQAANYDPNALKKVNTNKMIDEYANLVSVPPDIVRTDEEIAEIDEQEVRGRLRLNSQWLWRLQGAQTAKSLSETKLEDDNALGAPTPTSSGRTIS